VAEQDDLNRLLVEGPNYLGSQVRVPFQGQGDLSGSAGGGLPAAVVGTPGSGSAPGGRALGGGGADDLALALQSLGVAGKTGQSLTDLLRGGSTRGGTGGASLSDQLRGIPGLASLLGTPGGSGVGTLGGVPSALPFGTPLDASTVDLLFQQGFTGDQIREVMGGLEGVSSGGQGVAGAAPGTAEALGGGASGALGGISSGAGALSAILGLIASQTGNQDLATAASGVGAAGTAASTAGALAGGAAGGGIAGTGATTALGAVSAPAAVLAAPIIGTLLADSFFSKKGEDLLSDTIRTYQGDYATFNQDKLLPTEGAQGQALAALQQALPYVQSQEELGQLLNSYKQFVTTTTGAPLTGGDPSNIYGVGTIAGTGPVTHGQQTPTIDWGPQTQQLQALVQQLQGVLPGTAITDPTATLQGEAGMRLFDQFLPREQFAPLYTPGGSATDPGTGQTSSLGPGVYPAGQIAQAGAPSIAYGQPGYDYAVSGYPAPGQYLGSISPFWEQLMSQAGGGAAAAPGAPASTPMDSIAAAALATPPGDFAGGMLPEDERKKLLQ